MKDLLDTALDRCRIARCIGLLALCAAPLGGCGSSVDAGPSPGSNAQNATAGSPPPPFLDNIPDAPTRVAYGGQRHVLVHYTVAGAPSTLEYDENVWSDGHGNFTIVPGQVTSPPMTTEQAQFFAILQESRDGFFYRHRDFRIRDLRLFLQNWSVSDTGQQETVAGRVGSVLEFRRIGGAATWYRAWIDPQTGLVLRAEERDAGGQLVSRVEFSTFTLTPDFTGVALHGDRFAPTPLDSLTDTTAKIGFQVRVPSILPKGYRLESAEGLNDGTGNWARLAYGDGVEQVFFLETHLPPGQGGGTTPTDVDIGPKSVRIFRVGPWTVLQGRFNQDRVIVLGKVDETSLLRMLKSAIH